MWRPSTVVAACPAPWPSRAANGPHRLAVIQEHYGSFGKEVFEMMRQMAWFSVLILLEGWSAQRLVAPKAEYDKFVHFEKQSRDYASLVA